MTDDPHEEWRAVLGYEGLYEVSDLGRVRRVLGGYKNAKGGRVLLNDPDSGGHARVTLYRGLKAGARRFLVHRLVLAAFVGPCHDGMDGCHNDGDPTNNAVSNLRWDTRAANCADRNGHGTDPRGERNPNATLTQAQVDKIRETHERGGISQAAIAESYGVQQTTISRIVRGVSWTK